jgi:branched-subunit amino acid aminotransferase/4-amino-4-deoxychorismate lyase
MLHTGAHCLQEHIARIFQGAKAIDIDIALSPGQLQDLVYRTVDANGMSAASGVHIRLMITRGLKPTPYQNPNTTIGSPTIIILPEWKEASTVPKEQVPYLFVVA